MADDDEVAARSNLNPAIASLLDFQAFGWITMFEFAGTAGWTLTESGPVGNERQLARELDATNSAVRQPTRAVPGCDNCFSAALAEVVQKLDSCQTVLMESHVTLIVTLGVRR
jgi:hypothetical protein